jgi:hypothetical protein
MIISVKNNIGISALIKKFTELFKYDEWFFIYFIV